MSTPWKIAAAVPACVFIIVGLAWLIVPGFVSGQMRMALLTGDGLSTQVADLASFFLTLGGCILIALATNRAVWLYPSIMLLACGALGRVIAWLFHGAGLAPDMIAVEVVVAGLLILVARKMASHS